MKNSPWEEAVIFVTWVSPLLYKREKIRERIREKIRERLRVRVITHPNPIYQRKQEEREKKETPM